MNAHVESRFQFDVQAPMRLVAPQFAPVAEKDWGDPSWEPRFVWPQPERDVQGAVWTVRDAVWINTIFDVGRGRMQYVYFVPGVQVVSIDVRVTAAGEGATHVEVTYARTALAPGQNDFVRKLGEQDRESGPEWKKGVETALHR